MMTTQIPIKAPNLMHRELEGGFNYVVNCSVPNSLRLINNSQQSVFDAIDNITDVAGIAERLGVEGGIVASLMQLFSKNSIVRFDSGFSDPQKPAFPKSLNFWIHTTNKCNLSCSYCYISTLHQTGGMSSEVKHRLLEKLVETVQRRSIKHVKFRLAGGEPLTQFKSWKTFIPEARSILKALGCDLEISFISNLTILTDEILAFSQEHEISYGISLDGLDSYNDITRPYVSGEGSFETIDHNLKRLIEACISLSVNTVVTNTNLAGLPSLTRYLIDLDVPFRYSIVKGEAIDGELLDRYLTECYEIMEKAVEAGWSFSRRHQFCDLKPMELGFQTCASGFSGGAIYVDGTFNYCHVHFGDASEPSQSIFDDDLDLVDMIEQGSHYEDMKSDDCHKCRYKSICTSGCPVYRVNGKDPQCSIYHKFIPMIYDLIARERLKLLRQYSIIV